jgi:hypothetical protein
MDAILCCTPWYDQLPPDLLLLILGLNLPQSTKYLNTKIENPDNDTSSRTRQHLYRLFSADPNPINLDEG